MTSLLGKVHELQDIQSQLDQLRIDGSNDQKGHTHVFNNNSNGSKASDNGKKRDVNRKTASHTQKHTISAINLSDGDDDDAFLFRDENLSSKDNNQLLDSSFDEYDDSDKNIDALSQEIEHQVNILAVLQANLERLFISNRLRKVECDESEFEALLHDLGKKQEEVRISNTSLLETVDGVNSRSEVESKLNSRLEHLQEEVSTLFDMQAKFEGFFIVIGSQSIKTAKNFSKEDDDLDFQEESDSEDQYFDLSDYLDQKDSSEDLSHDVHMLSITLPDLIYNHYSVLKIMVNYMYFNTRS